MGPECALSERNSMPLATSHSLTVLSSLPLARIFPSGLKVTELTRPECPVSDRNSAPVVRSHNLIVLSSPPQANVLPSGPNATESTALDCLNQRNSTLFGKSHKTVLPPELPFGPNVPPSRPPNASVLPSVLSATE